jgi:cytosine/adenosine deaminase-related metal-dependent hydrolase
MLIIAEKVLTFGQNDRWAANAIVVRDTAIVDIGQATVLKKTYPRDRILDLGSAVLMPGLVNVHAHLELPSLMGKVRSSGYAQWVLNLLHAKKGLSQRDYIRAADDNIGTLIKTGTTTVGEICTHGASPASIRQHGLRAVVFHEIIAMGPGTSPLFPKGLKPTSLVVPGISPHSPHTVSEEALASIRDQARERELRLCMHVAETIEERRLLRGAPGGLDRLFQAAGWQREWAPRARSSVEYLFRMKVLSRSFLAVHAVHISTTDIALLRRRRASVAHCPRSNQAMQVGTMPLQKLLDAGVTVGIGTDSLASVPTLNLWDEMRFAFKRHSPHGPRPRDILILATAGGAKALGLENVIGSLKPGMKADIIAVPMPRRSSGDLAADLLRETKSCIMTMVNGTILHLEQKP